MPLDDGHMHRMQTVAAEEYSRLMAATIPDAQQRDMSWATAAWGGADGVEPGVESAGLGGAAGVAARLVGT